METEEMKAAKRAMRMRLAENLKRDREAKKRLRQLARVLRQVEREMAELRDDTLRLIDFVGDDSNVLSHYGGDAVDALKHAVVHFERHVWDWEQLVSKYKYYVNQFKAEKKRAEEI